ncbi:MAG: hypothetical protein K8H88_13480 [Sandaracinaceae bacterium]|nr:hypothetical protein [Sandaracinaceae bacterium]
MSLTAESPAIWIGPRTAWVPSGVEPISACTRSRCAPVVDTSACDAPACPGYGARVTVAIDIASVGGWPTDYGGFTAERDALIADSSLAGIHGSLSSHPDSSRVHEARERAAQANRLERERRAESVRWVSQHRHGDRWELGLGMVLGTLVEEDGSYLGPSGSIGLVHLLQRRHADESDDDETMMNILTGDTLGAELRVRALFRMDDAQAAHWIVSVGMAPIFENRFERSVARVPSFLGSVVPEAGVILREDRAPTWYIGWDLPFSFLIDHDIAVDLRAEILLVDDWIPKPAGMPDADDPAELIFGLHAGLRLP